MQYIFLVDAFSFGKCHITIRAHSRESAMKIAQGYQDAGEFRSWEYVGILSISLYNES